MTQEREHQSDLTADSLSYSAVPGVFDEMQEAPTRLRPHWRPFIEGLRRLGAQELVSRWQDGRRLIREHGVTYNVYGDPHGMDRPWDLDLVPLLITAQEWARLETGLIQRSRLFNLILADIYGGSQRLLRDGFIPPQLIYPNPAFLRACRGVPVRSDVYVHLHACDLGRSPDGQWWVLSDRTQAPGGTGYAWENRTVLSRLLPDEIRNSNIQSVGSFFRQERQMLFHLAPPGRPNPSVVLLTPGPHNEIYFEHAYLARHLGFPLVEGADMTVRDRRVFLKTVEGLQPVDVILRRVDDAFCDPLELRDDSFLGVSGLLDAARAGNVTIANSVGAGLMETPALLAFLPNLCRHLLGEELLLPSIATWWCGEAEELRYTTAHLDSLNLKSAFVQGPVAPANERAGLVELLQTAPHLVVAQERVPLSRAPAWVDTHLRARSVVLRTFIANGGDSVAVLPGGLTRVSESAEDLVISMQSGGGSKDTWVISNGTAQRSEPATVLTEPRLTEHTLRGVPSRAADHLFWLGRYTERLEQLLRVLGCVLGRISAEPGGEDSAGCRGLAGLAANLGLLGAPAEGHPDSRQLARRMLQLLYEPELTSGVRELIAQIRTTASAVRDRFSGDTWRILGRIDADACCQPGRLPLASATTLVHNLILDLAAFSGMEMENMTRGRGWRFLDFGRRLERGLSVLQLLQAAVSVQAQPSAVVLEPVLEIADSVMTYRRLYFDRPRLPGVLAVVLRDDSNPRSLAFQVHTLAAHAAALADDSKTGALQVEQARIAALAEAIRTRDLGELTRQHAHGLAQPLVDLLGAWTSELAGLSDQVTNRYFSHSLPRPS